MSVTDDFIGKYGSGGSLNHGEIVSGLRDGTARIVHVPEGSGSVNATELLLTYERRGKHLASFATPHAARLKAETETFCKNLRTRVNERCLAWIVEREPHYIYTVFEWASDRSPIADLCAVDDRKLTVEEQRLYWGINTVPNQSTDPAL